MNQNNKGFTVIELMAVVAIVSILTVIALAVYSDYVVRSKVAEAMGFAAEARTAVSGYYYTERKMPVSNSQAGLVPPEEYGRFDNIRRIEIVTRPKPGTIEITFRLVGTKADNKLLQLVPSTLNEIVFWTCRPPTVNGIDVNQVPPNCRG
ncbi:MAG: pilin [Halioglobus sp.]